jgi:multiple sugar transport system permease protein
LYLNTVEQFPLALGLRMFQGRYSTNWPILMAASAVFIAPTIIVFLVAQRHFIRGIHLTGLAGR